MERDRELRDSSAGLSTPAIGSSAALLRPDTPAMAAAAPQRWGRFYIPCCSKASVRFQFSEQREILLTELRGISFCSSGRGDN